MVECDLAKVDVEGSNPFRRSILLRRSPVRPRYGFAGIGPTTKSYEAIPAIYGLNGEVGSSAGGLRIEERSRPKRKNLVLH